MKSVNSVQLLGNVVRDPEIKVVGNNVKVAKFTVVTNKGGYTKQDGTEVKEETQFHRVIAWRGLAEVTEKLIKKGDSVFVQGEITYTEAEKNGVKVQYTDIVAEDISLCHSRQGVVNAAQQSVPQPQYNNPQPQYSAPQYNAPQFVQPQVAAQPQVQPMPQAPQVQQVWDGTQYVNAYQDPVTGQWVRV